MAKVLFFAPYAAIWPHARPEAFVAESLAHADHEILYVTCDGILSEHCVAMNAAGVGRDASPLSKALVCRSCRANQAVVRKKLGFRVLELAKELSPEDLSRVDALLSPVTRENFMQFRVDGLEIGRMAIYETLLGRKKGDLDFTDAEWREVRTSLRNCLLVQAALGKILDREKPEFFVTYNNLYSTNAVAYQMAEARGLTAYFLHAGLHMKHRLETLILGRGSTFKFVKALALKHWPRFRDRPCSPEQLRFVTEHFEELFKGSNVFVYSAPKAAGSGSIRKRFGITERQKVLVAATSSEDERFAGRTIGVLETSTRGAFSDQAEWIRETLNYVSKRPELFLIIRVHPREFPNKREGVKSDHARKLEQLLTNLPPNAVVNWPTDEISLYDLACEADVVLSAWSSAGVEMSLFGLPVVIYSSDMIVYPPELNYLGETREEYFAQIERALADGWSFEKVRQTYRWLALTYGPTILDISSGFDGKRWIGGGFLRRAMRKAARTLVPGYREARDLVPSGDRTVIERRIAAVFEVRADDSLSTADPRGLLETSLEEETRALMHEMGRLSELLGLKNLNRRGSLRELAQAKAY